MSLRVLSLLGLIIAGVALDEREGPLLATRSSGQGDATDFGLEGNASEILLFVMLANRELVVGHVVSLQAAAIADGTLLEIVELLLKGLLQVVHDFGALPLETQLSNGFLDGDADVGLLDDVLHLNIIIEAGE